MVCDNVSRRDEPGSPVPVILDLCLHQTAALSIVMPFFFDKVNLAVRSDAAVQLHNCPGGRSGSRHAWPRSVTS